MQQDTNSNLYWDLGNDINVLIVGSVLFSKEIIAVVKIGKGSRYIIPIDMENFLGDDPKTFIFNELISYFERLQLEANSEEDKTNSELFLTTLKNGQEGTYLNATAAFKEHYKKMEAQLKQMGFNVILLPSYTLEFYFMNRKQPVQVKCASCLKNDKRCIVFMDVDAEHYFTLDDVLEKVETTLKPVEGRRYMKSFLNTWEEFKNIRYKDGKITVEEKKDLSH